MVGQINVRHVIGVHIGRGIRTLVVQRAVGGHIVDSHVVEGHIVGGHVVDDWNLKLSTRNETAVKNSTYMASSARADH